jgi:hypothetical protein
MPTTKQILREQAPESRLRNIGYEVAKRFELSLGIENVQPDFRLADLLPGDLVTLNLALKVEFPFITHDALDRCRTVNNLIDAIYIAAAPYPD